MQLKNLTQKVSSLEKNIEEIANSQKKFTTTALQLLALSAKTIYSKEEAALFLNLEPDYLYQLKFHGKLRAFKKKGQKKIYFKKEDLENYLLVETENDDVNNYEEFESQITSNWKK